MLASPTKSNERVGMDLGLQQLGYDLALQTAEGGRRPHHLTCGTYCVDRDVRGEPTDLKNDLWTVRAQVSF